MLRAEFIPLANVEQAARLCLQTGNVDFYAWSDARRPLSAYSQRPMTCPTCAAPLRVIAIVI